MLLDIGLATIFAGSILAVVASDAISREIDDRAVLTGSKPVPRPVLVVGKFCILGVC